MWLERWLRRIGGGGTRGRGPPVPAARRGGFSDAQRPMAGEAFDPEFPRAPRSPDLAPAARPAHEKVFPTTGPHGHRARMREKLLARGPDALADYELLEDRKSVV